MEWSEAKIIELVNQGWSLSLDKTNKRFKLLKRINGKVKSYTLPRELNEFCEKLKADLELTKGRPIAEIFKLIDTEPFHWLRHSEKMSYDELEKLFERYCEEKSKEQTPQDMAKFALYSYLLLKKAGGVEVEEKILDIDYLEDEMKKLEFLDDTALSHARYYMEKCKYNKGGFCTHWYWKKKPELLIKKHNLEAKEENGRWYLEAIPEFCLGCKDTS
jgi:hypothetical protein